MKKLRKFEFKKVDMVDEDMDDAGNVMKTSIGFLDYRQSIKEILNTPTPGTGGLTSEEITKSVMLFGTIQAEFMARKKFALIEDDQWKYILGRLKGFKFRMAHKSIFEFIDYLNNLPEVEVVPTDEQEPDRPKAKA